MCVWYIYIYVIIYITIIIIIIIIIIIYILYLSIYLLCIYIYTYYLYRLYSIYIANIYKYSTQNIFASASRPPSHAHLTRPARWPVGSVGAVHFFKLDTSRRWNAALIGMSARTVSVESRCWLKWWQSSRQIWFEKTVEKRSSGSNWTRLASGIGFQATPHAQASECP